MFRERSFANLRSSRESSSARSIIGRLFPTEADEKLPRVFNMNDARRDLDRHPSRVFQRSNQESQLFQKGVRKVQLQLTEPSERSSSRRYRNQSKFNLDPNLSKHPDSKPVGVRKIVIQSKNQKSSSRRHIKHPTTVSNEDSSTNFVVPLVNTSSNCRQQKQVIIKIGRNRTSQTENRPQKVQKVILHQRKHFQAVGEEVGQLLTDRSIQGRMDFDHDYYKKLSRIPKQPKENKVSGSRRLFSDRGCLSSRLMR